MGAGGCGCQLWASSSGRSGRYWPLDVVSEEIEEGGATYLDINDDERQQTLLFVVWLPHRCRRRGTWWALVDLVTWRCGIVLQW